MCTVVIVVVFEFVQFSLKVKGIPERHVIQIFASNGADHSFDERMRHRRIRKTFDLRYFQDSQICAPPMKSEKRIIVATEVAGWIGPRNGVVEHPAYGHTIYRSLMNAETNDSAAVLIHDNQNPIGLKR